MERCGMLGGISADSLRSLEMLGDSMCGLWRSMLLFGRIDRWQTTLDSCRFSFVLAHSHPRLIVREEGGEGVGDSPEIHPPFSSDRSLPGLSPVFGPVFDPVFGLPSTLSSACLRLFFWGFSGFSSNPIRFATSDRLRWFNNNKLTVFDSTNDKLVVGEREELGAGRARGGRKANLFD